MRQHAIKYGLYYQTVVNHFKQGHCSWPRRTKPRTGITKHYLYGTWKEMKSRCYNNKHEHYSYYGQRGITVCQEWLDDFSNFIRDMGDRPEGYTLDRIDNDKGYSKDNCRWSSKSEQSYNKKLGNSRGIRKLSNGKWDARISKDNIAIFLGVFLTQEEAKTAWNKAAIDIFGYIP